MRFQLTLQFRGDSLAEFDTMVTLEDALVEDVGVSPDVDGHDCGSRETYIFILTSDPDGSFLLIKPELERMALNLVYGSLPTD